ncbi:hypothetical protein ACONUD_16920 [Microbulbifer harenosus]|uniref:Uncharacterized protein n=1 Tax=Microbulbifer harenosus TaxID=2576840 RepID=A0ABY2UID8_9GAMM|nr:hypothetical protein [Microbulbifer harenosus]TLM74302.1 hypothetical protein FDY93_17725 [Microbulbifer harenosus]
MRKATVARRSSTNLFNSGKFVTRFSIVRPIYLSSKHYGNEICVRFGPVNTTCRFTGKLPATRKIGAVGMSSFSNDAVAENLDKVIRREFSLPTKDRRIATRPFLDFAPSCRSAVTAVQSALSQRADSGDVETRIRFREYELLDRISRLLGYSRIDTSGVFDLSHDLTQWYGFLLAHGSHEMVSHQGRDSRLIISGRYCSSVEAYLTMSLLSRQSLTRIPTRTDGETDVDRVMNYLESCFRRGIAIGGILLSTGQLYTGASDPVAAILEETDRLRQQYGVLNRPHIRLDIPLHWPLLLFRNYDFRRNPLVLPERASTAIESIRGALAACAQSDSCSINLGRWGYSPLPLSLLIVKNYKQLRLLVPDTVTTRLESKPDSGFPQRVSSPASATKLYSLEGLVASFTELGEHGLQHLAAGSIDRACYLKTRLQEYGDNHVLFPGATSPLVSFRRYPTKMGNEAAHHFREEVRALHSGNSALLRANTIWHFQQFSRRKERGLRTAWLTAAHLIDERAERMEPLAAETAAMMDPHITHAHIDAFIETLHRETASGEPVLNQSKVAEADSEYS